MQQQKSPQKNRTNPDGNLKILGHIILTAVFLGIFLLPGVMASGFQNNESYANVFIGNVKTGNLKKKELRKKIEETIKKYKKKPLKIIYKGKGALLTPGEIGAHWDIEETIKKIPLKNRGIVNVFSFAENIFENRQIKMEIKINTDKMRETIKKNFEFQEVKNAKIIQKKKELMIEKEKTGESFDDKKLKHDLEKTLENLLNEPITLDGKKFLPDIASEMLEKNLEILKTKLTKPIKILAGEKEKIIHPQEYLNEIKYKKSQKILLASREIPGLEEKIEIEMDSGTLKKIIRDGFSEKWEYSPLSLKISMNGKGNIAFEGKGKPGAEIEYDEAVRLINAVINKEDKNIAAVELPIRKIPNEIFISENLQALGIKELLADGYTAYYGSPANRMHNIKNGIEKFNGLMIKPGEIFSFNEHLGKVDGSTGYKKELVIKPEGTIPEYGGGICQVSTTMYRAALYAGLPITERKPHSYVVAYYAQVGGHGIDATIYPGANDLKFVNDTPGNILIQSYAEGAEAHFKFYGTSDGRKVSLEGPIISNHRSPGATEMIKTTQIPIDAKKQVEKPHNGFDTLWYRTIVQPNGEIKKEEIISKYRAVSARILVGAEASEITGGTPAGEQYFRD